MENISCFSNKKSKLFKELIYLQTKYDDKLVLGVSKY